jgi:hypothetical protein
MGQMAQRVVGGDVCGETGRKKLRAGRAAKMDLRMLFLLWKLLWTRQSTG